MERSCNLLVVILILFLVVIFFGELLVDEGIPRNIRIGFAIVGSPQVLYDSMICAMIYVLILSVMRCGIFFSSFSVIARE